MRQKNKGKTGIKFVAVMLVAMMVFPFFTACSRGEEKPDPNKATVEVSSAITEVSEGHEITIRVLVKNSISQKVTFTSADETIATVQKSTDTTAKVTGIKAGKVKITATLVADASVFTSVEITVNPAPVTESISFTGEANRIGWVDESEKLTVVFVPENSNPLLNYTSSDETVATVDNGLVSFLMPGTVKITAACASDASKTAEVNYTVKNGALYTQKGGYANNFSYDNQADENPYIISQELNKEVGAENPAAIAWFKVAPSQRYYAQATFTLMDSTNDSWARFGMGSGTNNNDTRGFYFSDKEGQKTMVMNLPNDWGPQTARTMTWQVNNIRSFDKTNITIGVLRDGDKYYYTINGLMYWYEETAKFKGINTLPVILSKDVQVKAADFTYTNDDATLNNMLSSADFQKKLYESSSNMTSVEFRSDSEFIFKNTGTQEWEHRFRDQCVRGYGEKVRLSGNFTIEFNLTGLECVSGDTNSMLGVALRRYEANVPTASDLGMADSFMLNNDYFHFRTWDYELQFPAIISSASKNSAAFSQKITTTDTVSVKIERTIVDYKAHFKMYLNGVEYKFGANGDEELILDYIDDYFIVFGANNAKGHITNFQFSSEQ